MGWYEEGVIYQIYPLGFCGAPHKNTGRLVHRIRKITKWIPYYKELGIDAILFNPVFESDHHGYDTRNYQKLDVRLGTNQDFSDVCNALHEAGIKVILDGVFNHVGRGFFAFMDVLEKKEQSKYKDWFYIRFGEDNAYHDGLFYEGWEGHYELVKLNLNNEEVVTYLFDSIRMWVEEFGIDGLRLDVAYCLDREFLRRLRELTESLKKEFVLIGEVLFGDYNMFVNDTLLQSCTNYECYKGIYSSLNDLNLFEINYSLNRQFSTRQNGIYLHKKLLNFVDNHDVSRIASILMKKEHLPLAATLLFTMPGVPCIYYGSEWGIAGNKQDGDHVLRPKLKEPVKNELYYLAKLLTKIYKSNKALQYGDYETVSITNRQLAFMRSGEGEKILVVMNADETPFTLKLSEISQTAVDLLTQETMEIAGEITLSCYKIRIFKL